MTRLGKSNYSKKSLRRVTRKRKVPQRLEYSTSMTIESQVTVEQAMENSDKELF